MLKYNICFVRRGSEILLLNRERSSWMGRWNGVGGKLEQDEEPRASMIRELEEETGILDYELRFKGAVTWSSGGSQFGGMYVYLADVSESLVYPTPVKTDEGILDWKTIEWIMHEQNEGIASNVPRALSYMLHDDRCYDHHCLFSGHSIVDQTATAMMPEFETDPAYRERYLLRYSAAIGQTSR
ncbi:8-oxo-dGTP diphosphatase [Paenibacillus sp. N4]|uniref:NUDIX hydrolase n=1 Tax=Paenibacillus vietnamensis TaxID=2590547 RepID=UPI001CD0FF67|nr:8-oxo-dGTP diphosphatase [Paenibacillus vietnamensis]MCA0754179.1 8-oxo-dGTP diphosphatase [Paenibacillus vietnamensis]